jgi:hypothetical protein
LFGGAAAAGFHAGLLPSAGHGGQLRRGEQHTVAGSVGMAAPAPQQF